MKTNSWLLIILIIGLINLALLVFLTFKLVFNVDLPSSNQDQLLVDNQTNSKNNQDLPDNNQSSEQITFNNWTFNIPAGWETKLINEQRLGLDIKPFPTLGGEYTGKINLSTYNDTYRTIDEAKKYFYDFHSLILEENNIKVDGYPAIQFAAEGYQGKPSPDTADQITYIDRPKGVLAVELIFPEQATDEYQSIIASLKFKD